MIKGFKIFNSDWACNGKQYTCPGKFEEDVTPSVCGKGMHFCREAVDCFNYYEFNPKNKVAEVIAYGEISEERNRCCTNKLEIVREIPWAELLGIVNTGKYCTGLGNTGDYNNGDCNSGDWNNGDCNSGNCNNGDYNIGIRNTGNRNSGDHNTGDYNSGIRNTGDWNTGDYNNGDCNSGDWNNGIRNSGNCNTGDCNSGSYNTGDCNSGDWNKCSFSNGCFNTVESKIYLFNKPSEWTYSNWLKSEARCLLNKAPANSFEWVNFCDMTDEEKRAFPESEFTGGCLRSVDCSDRMLCWWKSLSKQEKDIIKAIPNFDKEIFKQITGIDTGADEKCQH